MIVGAFERRVKYRKYSSCVYLGAVSCVPEF